MEQNCACLQINVHPIVGSRRCAVPAIIANHPLGARLTMIVKPIKLARNLLPTARRPAFSTQVPLHQAMTNAAQTRIASRRARERFVRREMENEPVFDLTSATPGVPSRRSVMTNTDVEFHSSASQMLIVKNGRYARVMLLKTQRPVLNSKAGQTLKKSPSKTSAEPVKNVKTKTQISRFARRATRENFVSVKTNVYPTALRLLCVLSPTAAKLLHPASLTESVVLGKPVSRLSEESQGSVRPLTRHPTSTNVQPTVIAR